MPKKEREQDSVYQVRLPKELRERWLEYCEKEGKEGAGLIREFMEGLIRNRKEE